MGKIKRKLIKSFLKTSSTIWSLIGPGVAAADIELKPQVESFTAITDDNATVTVEGYEAGMPIEAIANNGDGVFEWIDAARKGRDTLEDAETEIVNCWYYETTDGNFCRAEKLACAVSVEKFGGKGGVSAKVNYTINMIGESEVGWFDPCMAEWFDNSHLAKFFPSPILAGLTSLVIAGTPILPAFASDIYWYYGGTDDATSTITAVPVTAGATIAIDVNGSPVTNGDPATWVFGENHVTVTVTVGSEVVHYYLKIFHTLLIESIAIDGVTLTPSWTVGHLVYTATTTDASNEIHVVCHDMAATIAIDHDGDAVDNGDPIAWTEGVNIVTVSITAGPYSQVYTITVTATLGGM